MLAIAIGLAAFALWQITILFRATIRSGWVFFRLAFYIILPVALALWLGSISMPLVLGAFS